MNTRLSLVLGNVTLPSGRVADISLANGVVTHLGAAMHPADRIDCTGLLVLPAAVDMHVHMRGGAQSAKEDWKTGSQSAIAGGVTVVVDQPNTIPPITTPQILAKRVRDAQKNSLCHFAINSGVACEVPLEGMWEAGAMAFGEIFFAPSSYGNAMGEDELAGALRRVQALGALATIHAEEVLEKADTDLAAHDKVRPPSGEVKAVRSVQRCNHTGCRLHFCHLSMAASVAAAQGSVEVAPHHLFLSREHFINGDTYAKVNPPLRVEQEQKRLWEQWDRIDVIASDHAPHTMAEKQADFEYAPAGIPGVETMMPLLLAQVIQKRISLQSVIKKTSLNPAMLLGIQKAGFEIGDRADFALYPKQPAPIHAESLHSRCGWTPFEGHAALFPSRVIMGGVVVYCEGEFFFGNPAWFAGKGKK